MSQIQELLVVYERAKDRQPQASFVPDREMFNQMRADAKKYWRFVSVIDNDSLREGDPVLSILVVSDDRLNNEMSKSISQDVINWLMDNGHMVKR